MIEGQYVYDVGVWRGMMDQNSCRYFMLSLWPFTRFQALPQTGSPLEDDLPQDFHMHWLAAMSSHLEFGSARLSPKSHQYSSLFAHRPNHFISQNYPLKNISLLLWFSSSLQIWLQSALHNETTHAHFKRPRCKKRLVKLIVEFPTSAPNVTHSPHSPHTSKIPLRVAYHPCEGWKSYRDSWRVLGSFWGWKGWPCRWSFGLLRGWRMVASSVLMG